MNKETLAGLLGTGSSVIGSLPIGNRNNSVLDTAVYGDSSSDPIMRFINDITGNSTKQAIDNINSDININTGYTDNDSLLARYNSMPSYNKYNIDRGTGLFTAISTALGAPWLDYENGKVSFSSDNLMASAKGAAAGSSFGPWGALIGGIAGGVLNLGSRLGRYDRAQKINSAIDHYNNTNQLVFNQTVNNSKNKQMQNAMINMAALGGPLETHGSNFNNNVTEINEGGKHEQNPYGGIPVSIAEDGKPNLVEEGEVIFKNNLVLSDRMKVSSPLKKFYGELNDDSPASYAKNSDTAKEAKERMNDPLSTKAYDKMLATLYMDQEQQKAEEQQRQQANYAALGGHLHYLGDSLDNPSFKNPFIQTVFDTDNKVLPISVNPKLDFQYTKPNVERVNYGIRTLTPSGFKAVTVSNPSDIPIQNEVISPVNNNGDFILDSTLPVNYRWDNPTPEEKPYVNPEPYYTAKYETFPGNRKNLTASLDNNVKSAKANTASPYSTFGRKAALAADLATLVNNLRKPDYSDIDKIDREINAINPYEGYNPLGNYMTYNPIDINSTLARIDANEAANRRAIINSSNGNRALANASLAALDYNSNNTIGDVALKAQLQNEALKQQVAAFNHEINKANSAMDMQSKQNRLHAQQLRTAGRSTTTQMRNQLDMVRNNALSQALSGLTADVMGVGRENFIFNQLQNAGYRYNYKASKDGSIAFTNANGDTVFLDEAGNITTPTKTAACGGKLRTKKK